MAVIRQITRFVTHGEIADGVPAVGQLHGVPVLERWILTLVANQLAGTVQHQSLNHLPAPAFHHAHAEVSTGAHRRALAKCFAIVWEVSKDLDDQVEGTLDFELADHGPVQN